MVECKLKYIEIPKNNVKPIDYFIHNKCVHGERLYFNTAKEIENLIRQKFDEGWNYFMRVESEAGYVIYFKREK